MRLQIERAYELSERLPLRERRLVWVLHTRYQQGRTLVARDSLRRFIGVYPEDPRVWHALGEVLFHGNVPGGWPEAEEAFEKAAELDPRVAQHHHHLVDLAMSLHRDSAMAAQRIAAHPEGAYKQAFRLALDLVFGTDEQRQDAFARLDSVPPSLPLFWMRDALAHPADGLLQAEVLEVFRDRIDIDLGFQWLAVNRLKRGQIDEAMSLLQDEEADQTDSTCVVALSLSLGYPIPKSLQLSYFKLAEINLEEASPTVLHCAAIYLIEEGRDEELDLLVDNIRARRQRAEGYHTAEVQGVMNELHGYRAWKAGDEGQAARHWSESKRPFWPTGAIWRGDLYRELGELEEAKGWYMAAWKHPVAHEGLGLVYEEMNRPEEAAEAYERFVEAWADADEPLQERVEAARARLESLTKEAAVPVLLEP